MVKRKIPVLVACLQLAGCAEEPRTALRLAVNHDTRLALDQLRVSAQLQNEAGERGPFVLPDRPEPLAQGVRVVLLFPDDWGGKTVSTKVVGLSLGKARAEAQALAELKTHEVVDTSVQLCASACSAGQTECVGTKIRHCVAAASGCGNWGAEELCPPAQPICRDGACIQCQPRCDGQSCGADDGCGGKCQTGSCGSNATCNAGACVCNFAVSCGASCCASGQVCKGSSCCTPDCAGRKCGSDPVCGSSSCGTCTTGSCNPLGQCELPPPPPPPSWTLVPPLTANYLRGVWGSASDDVWAVGDSGTMLHYDGNQWSLKPASSPVSFMAVWGAAKNDIWAAGGGAIWHYNGVTWSQAWKGSPYLYDIWGSSANDLWAVGTSAALLHSTGGSWTFVTNPAPATATLRGIWGSSASDIWIAGDDGVLYHNLSGSFTSHPLTTQKFYGVSGLSAQNVWAFGQNGTFFRLVGGGWVDQSPKGQHIYDVWGESLGDLWTVGSTGALRHFDGITWNTFSSGTTNWLEDAWGIGPSDIWVVGEKGTILHYH